ncbi:hypothetical protein GCM10009808_17890 [Microbacterium sediminicola]|uniref:Uncharacterized protein n=1 Tax=Microbacterium sediminicola TaxID=415210 RepID=A0ABP4U9D0_9MICO
MNDRRNAVRPITEPLPETEPLPVIWERRDARPVRAAARETGLGLVPEVRPIGLGGLADMLAVRRHNRRLSARRAQAA